MAILFKRMLILTVLPEENELSVLANLNLQGTEGRQQKFAEFAEIKLTVTTLM